MQEETKLFIRDALAAHEALPLFSEQYEVALRMLASGVTRKEAAAKINRHVGAIERIIIQTRRMLAWRRRNPTFQSQSYLRKTPEDLKKRRLEVQIEKKRQAISRAQERIARWQEEVRALEAEQAKGR